MVGGPDQVLYLRRGYKALGVAKEVAVSGFNLYDHQLICRFGYDIDLGTLEPKIPFTDKISLSLQHFDGHFFALCAQFIVLCHTAK
jgi:hypothetical protein